MCAVTLGDNVVTKELHFRHELNTGVDTCSVVPVVMVTAHLVEFVVMSNEFEISQHESVFLLLSCDGSHPMYTSMVKITRREIL